MLHYFETLRDIFADECHPKSEEDWAKTYKEHGKLFKETYAEFQKLFDDYNMHREVRNGSYQNHRDAKYPWGYLSRFETVHMILYKLNNGTYHIKTFYNDVNHHDWQAIHSDIRYVLGWYNKKLADRRKRKREARKQQKLSRNLT